jgi:potassium large conductance calcium-activated channel subfamily M alpha protein 1
MNYYLIGMRFFRIARILNIPDILQFLHILRSSNSIRLTRMLCLLFTVWLSAAGFIHLVIINDFYREERELNNF